MTLPNRSILLGFLFPALLSGCVVGPDYRRPEPAIPAAWQSEAGTSLKTASLETGELAQWWQSLGDPLLSRLVVVASADNLDLKLAGARLREARSRRGLAAADRLPVVKGGGGVSRSRSGDLYSAQLDASWELDLFGAKGRALEAASATAEAAEENLRDLQVSLLAEVVLSYIDIRSCQGQISIVRDTITSLTDTLQIVDWRNQAGLVSGLDLEQARANLEQTRAQLPSLVARLDQSLNNLCLLLGREPGAFPELKSAGPIPSAAAPVAMGIPAETVRRRPDIRRAERQLAAATAQIGVAEAARYPNLSISGTLGLQASSLGAFLQSGAYLYSLAANTAMTIFDGGRLKQQVETESALKAQALISYQSAVKGALRDVENGLIAFAWEQNRRQSLASAVQSARSASSLAASQYAAGLTDFQTVLETQRSLLLLEDQLLQSEAAVTSNLARLYKALGGGWSPVSPDTTDTATSSGEKS